MLTTTNGAMAAVPLAPLRWSAVEAGSILSSHCIARGIPLPIEAGRPLLVHLSQNLSQDVLRRHSLGLIPRFHACCARSAATARALYWVHAAPRDVVAPFRVLTLGPFVLFTERSRRASAFRGRARLCC
jgi:hypothetical protein